MSFRDAQKLLPDCTASVPGDSVFQGTLLNIY